MAPSADDLPEQRLLADELVANVHAAIATLPPAQREVVTLRDVEGLTSEDVCELLELRRPTSACSCTAAVRAYAPRSKPTWCRSVWNRARTDA